MNLNESHRFRSQRQMTLLFRGLNPAILNNDGGQLCKELHLVGNIRMIKNNCGKIDILRTAMPNGYYYWKKKKSSCTMKFALGEDVLSKSRAINKGSPHRQID